jgi:solute carrier family 34 (sodium-dependent phosphate cotransporter)
VRTRDAARRAALVGVGLLAFVFALELLKKGAAGIGPLLRSLHVAGVLGGVGFGWLMACVVLSGSPVAAIALALLASGTLSTPESFAMIGGSRLGASFVVLVIGLLDDLRNRRTEKRSAYIGVAALVATAIVYVPAMALGLLGLEAGLFRGLRIEGRDLASLVSRLYGPALDLAVRLLPRFLVFVSGILVLLGSFRLFDGALPDLQGRDSPMTRAGRVAYRPWVMFAIGLLVTSMTLSVSVSLSLLVPLAAKGYVRRENVCPYILGANITTFIDTLFAGALVGHPDAVRVVALMMGSVTLLSLPVILLVPYAFERLVDRIARRATRSTRSLVVFTALLFLVPALLILVSARP